MADDSVQAERAADTEAESVASGEEPVDLGVNSPASDSEWELIGKRAYTPSLPDACPSTLAISNPGSLPSHTEPACGNFLAEPARSMITPREDSLGQQRADNGSPIDRALSSWLQESSTSSVTPEGHSHMFQAQKQADSFDFGPLATSFGESSGPASENDSIMGDRITNSRVRPSRSLARPPNRSKKLRSPNMPLLGALSSSNITDQHKNFVDTVCTAPSSFPAFSLPIFQFKSMIQNQVILTPRTSEDESTASVLAPPAPSLQLRASKCLVEEHLGSSEGIVKAKQSLDDNMRALFPGDILSNPPSGALSKSPTDQQPNELNYPDLMVFLMSNKLLNLDSKSMRKVYRWINSNSGFRSLENLTASGGATVEALLEQLVVLAVQKGDHRTLEKILSLGGRHIDLSTIRCSETMAYADAETPLEVASRMQNSKMIGVLLKAGADVNQFTGHYTCLSLALGSDEGWPERTKHRDMEVIWQLLQAGAKMDGTDGGDSFSTIVENCQPELIAALLSHGADPNEPDYEDCSPLMKAVGSSAPISDVMEVTKILIRAGANVSFKSPYGDYDDNNGPRSVLQSLRRPQSLELLKFLVTSGARIEEKEVLYAIEDFNEEALKFLLASGARVTAKIIGKSASHGPRILKYVLGCAEDKIKKKGLKSAFITAIEYGNEEVFQFLSKEVARADFDYEPGFEKALGSCAERGDLPMFRLLLSDESPCGDAIIPMLGKALCTSIADQDSELTDFLLTAGADPDARVHEPFSTPLLEALRGRLPELVERLLGAGASVDWVNYDGNYTRRVSVLPAAVMWGDLPIIRKLITAGVDINSFGPENEECALVQAVRKGHRALVELMIENGADVNSSRGNVRHRATALEVACQHNDPGMVKYLLTNGADPCERCLIAAVQHEELLRVLYNAKLRLYRRYPQGFGARALQYAIANSHRKSIRFLIISGVDLNFIVKRPFPDKWTDKFGIIHEYEESAFGTLLRLSEIRSYFEEMLNHGANLNSVVAKQGDLIPILAAIKRGNLKIVQMLIKAGADVNPQLLERCSRTPLQAAVETGSMRITKALIGGGAYVNASACRRLGATALQLAAIKGFMGITSLLLEHGAQIDAPPAKLDGRTALEGAAENGRLDMVQFLVDSGAALTGAGEAQYHRARRFALERGHRAIWLLLERCRVQQLNEELVRQISHTAP